MDVWVLSEDWFLLDSVQGLFLPFAETLIPWMSTMWRRITNWPLTLLRKSLEYLPLWLERKWHPLESQISCPWWCTSHSSMRCSKTPSPLVVSSLGHFCQISRLFQGECVCFSDLHAASAWAHGVVTQCSFTLRNVDLLLVLIKTILAAGTK